MDYTTQGEPTDGTTASSNGRTGSLTKHAKPRRNPGGIGGGGHHATPGGAISGLFKPKRGENINIQGEARHEIYLHLSSDTLQVISGYKTSTGPYSGEECSDIGAISKEKHGNATEQQPKQPSNDEPTK